MPLSIVQVPHPAEAFAQAMGTANEDERRLVQRLAVQMLRKLRMNRGKNLTRHWLEYAPSELMGLAYLEMEELQTALVDRVDVEGEAADVANFVGMILDVTAR